MDFARKQLEKYGWTEGRGLGKNEDGITNPLKPALKFDNCGVGHDAGEQFTNNWWERLFNSASNNINVDSSGADGVKLKLKSKDSVEITTKNYSIRERKKNKNLEYGSFLKSSKLTASGEQSYNVSVPEPMPAYANLTDDDLFKACGGRTAHKGARHGLKLSGKLSRIEKQEKMLLKKMKNVSLSENAEKDTHLDKKLKKLKKQKEPPSGDVEDKKKHKKKRKCVTFSHEMVIKYYTPEVDTSLESSKEDNSIDPVETSSNGSDEGIEQDMENQKKTTTDDSHRSFQEVQKHFSDMSKAEKKKLKKLRKLEKKTATEMFIAEVQMEVVEKRRKRKSNCSEVEPSLDDACAEPSTSYTKKENKKKKNKRLKKEKLLNSIVVGLDKCLLSDDE